MFWCARSILAKEPSYPRSRRWKSTFELYPRSRRWSCQPSVPYLANMLVCLYVCLYAIQSCLKAWTTSYRSVEGLFLWRWVGMLTNTICISHFQSCHSSLWPCSLCYLPQLSSSKCFSLWQPLCCPLLWLMLRTYSLFLYCRSTFYGSRLAGASCVKPLQAKA